MAGERKPELASVLFRALDDHGQGCLRARELRRFAEGLIGFEGGNEDWAEVYEDLGKEYGWEAEAGADCEHFTRMLHDRDGVAYASDADVEAFLAKMGGATSADSGGASQGLPPMPRGEGFPSLLDLPEKHRKGLEQPLRSPRARLLCFYGASDAFASWAKRWLVEAPAWAETAVYEARGHGLREAEELDSSMEERAEDAWKWLRPIAAQHCPGGPAEGAPLALLGHSIGCQLVTLVGARMRKELSVEPSAVFVLDRAPPHLHLWSEEGYERLRSEPLAFFESFDPPTAGILKAAGGTAMGEQMLKRWQNGFMLGYEVQEEAQHKFSCPLVVFVCSDVWAADEFFKSGKMPKEDMRRQSQRSKLLQSRTDSCAQFEEAQFASWRRWTSRSSRVVKLANATHYSIKDDDRVFKAVFDDLAQLCGVGSAKP